MVALEDLKPGQQITGIIPNQSVTLIDVTWHGRSAIEITYKRPNGQTGNQLIFREQAAALQITHAQRTWSFTADADAFKLAAEAYRIHLAHLFDPVLAVHTSLVEPLPHQITAVYGEMLTRQPLRFLLADDPGAGKTIMAGLLIKELIVRGDVRRCLICAPGNLAGQWQDELYFKFHLNFDILTRLALENSVTGNPFAEKDQLIIRLDQVARSDDLLARLERSDWDLIIIDEAHKMSAHLWAGEIEETRRYKLGKALSSITRHFLLMTATPHNGKEADFQLFLGLLDPDRFENRSGSHTEPVDVSDIMRRMVKENLRRFDGRPLFPERRAYTATYHLTPAEKQLYEAVTDYVRQEFNRADQLDDDRRRGAVGFALTVLQRRLASSPEAIYQSLVRRRERLENRLQEVRAGQADLHPLQLPTANGAIFAAADDWQDFDEKPAEEAEEIEQQVLDSATAALTISELEAEIETLRGLERIAQRVRHSGADRKWDQLAALLQDNQHMIAADGTPRKLVIFTEHRDTLRYLHARITTLFGRDNHIVHIDGSLQRAERRAVEDRFRNDPHVYFLIATDAAGEGINLQRAHLMVNYDLPWNPNRLEQRFGRIHRIGQTEVCHLWNLVAADTREGYVYERLLRKLENERQALDGQVFDVLGELFTEAPLRRLLIEAVRYGDLPDVRARLDQAVDNAVDREHVRSLLEARSLAAQTMDLREIERIRAAMERYAVRRLQPFYIKAFFLQAFAKLGGALREREPGRYQIRYVPAAIRDRAKALATAVPVLREYERICFEKEQIGGPPLAQFICPGHPLLDALIDLLLEQQQPLLQAGTILVDETDPGDAPRMLYFLEHAIRDAVGAAVSQEVHFVEIEADGRMRVGGYAPYLDYRPATPAELAQLDDILARSNRFSGPQEVRSNRFSGPQEVRSNRFSGLPDPVRSNRFSGPQEVRSNRFSGLLDGAEHLQKAITHAIENLAPRHLDQVRQRRAKLIDKTLAAVQQRLTREINYWDGRAAELRRQEQQGRRNARLNSQQAQKRANELADRLQSRKAELELERQLSAAMPVVIGGALILPLGLLLGPAVPPELTDRRITEAIAMRAVAQAEIALGCHPHDVSQDNLGYDIESLDPHTGRLRFIEVKGRRAGADTVTVTKNEILCGFNMPDQFILALVEVADGQPLPPRYVRRPFTHEPDPRAASVNFRLSELLSRSDPPD